MQPIEKPGVMALAPEGLKATPLPPEVLSAIVTKHLRRDPAECIENHEGCAGTLNLRECIHILEEIIVDLFNDHLAEAPNLPAPHVDDSVLLQIAQTNANENPVQFIRNHWLCASTRDVFEALKEVRELHEGIYNKGAVLAGLLVEMPTADTASAAQAIKAPSKPDAGSPSQPQGWQPYATAPRDGSVVDLFYQKADGARGRVTNVQFIPAAQVNIKFAPGGEWEHLAQDGWRRSAYDESTLTDVGFTHWRLAAADMPADL